MARLSELPRRDRERSSRVNDVWRPLGLHHELRLVFRVDGVCWGAAGMVRTADFTDREVEFLTAVAPALACATRVAARAGGGPERPAIVVVTADGEVRAATAAAREWRDELDDIAPGRFTVMVRAVVSGARAAPSGTFGARVRGSRGGWILLRAARLVSDDDETAVTLERASGDALVDLLFAAYGLTPREREICREVLTGASTVDTAEALGISAHTVQDHLKVVFAKAGVRIRGESAARLRG
ncbi:helix-turn-helix transcriptional regulator [Amycolatopsis thermoflava]|uniref:helix-turn-helix transcriptional regulator n=1 Tax=Amycolatopsis thermoflava TaxID=84480 RepID=UPI0004121863|nr:helix-turn-helix transcriptional regulator [Amycolatopsis thermoflava]